MTPKFESKTLLNIFEHAAHRAEKTPDKIKRILTRLRLDLRILSRLTGNEQIGSIYFLLVTYDTVLMTYADSYLKKELKERLLKKDGTLRKALLNSDLNENDIMSIIGAINSVNDLTDLLTDEGTIDREIFSEKLFRKVEGVLEIDKMRIALSELAIATERLFKNVIAKDSANLCHDIVEILRKNGSLDNVKRRIEDNTLGLHKFIDNWV